MGILTAIFEDLKKPVTGAKEALMKTNTAIAIKDAFEQRKDEKIEKQIDKKVMEKVIEIKAETLAKKKTEKLTKANAKAEKDNAQVKEAACK